jgi:hypothetical protein
MWVGNIKMDLGERSWGVMDWVGLAHGRGEVEGSFESGNEPFGSITFWEVLEWVHYWTLSSSAQLRGVSELVNLIFTTSVMVSNPYAYIYSLLF